MKPRSAAQCNSREIEIKQSRSLLGLAIPFNNAFCGATPSTELPGKNWETTAKSWPKTRPEVLGLQARAARLKKSPPTLAGCFTASVDVTRTYCRKTVKCPRTGSFKEFWKTVRGAHLVLSYGPRAGDTHPAYRWTPLVIEKEACESQ